MLKRFTSMLKALLVVLATLPVFIPASAQAWLHPGSAGTCVHPTDNGCAAANKNGSFQSAALLVPSFNSRSSATQSGQSSLLASHPMTFNIPGVDYPVGPDKTLTPKDPRTITADATTPCAYLGTGGNAPPNDYVACFGAGTFPNAVLDNYDFAGTKIGKAPLTLYLNSDALSGSKITLTNDYFAIPDGTLFAKAIGYNGPSGGNWSITAKNIQCDGTNAGQDSQFCFWNDNGEASATTVDIEYSAFTNVNGGRLSSGSRFASYFLKYNFIQGINDLLTANHGEVDIRSCSGGDCVVPISHQEGNFIIWNRNPTDSVNNATFFLSTGNTNRFHFSVIDIINNVVVTNVAANGSPPVGKTLFNTFAASLGAVTITGNWIDPNGSFLCGVNGSVTGTATASTSGNTITLTASTGYANNPIEVGWMIFHAGFTPATITALGTGTGNLGTYTFDGPAQNLGSSDSWTLVPGYTSANLSSPENYLLSDPGHTGIPTAVGFTGPQFAATNCF